MTPDPCIDCAGNCDVCEPKVFLSEAGVVWSNYSAPTNRPQIPIEPRPRKATTNHPPRDAQEHTG